MPTITLTLTDTPTGGVAMHSHFDPAIGPIHSPAQAAALDIIARTKLDWLTVPALVVGTVDIDAVHRTRDRVITPQASA